MIVRSMETDLTEDMLLGGRVRLLQPRRGYRVAVDAVLLAAAVDAAAGERVLDLGAGVGAVGLCLAARVHGCMVDGHRGAAGAGTARRTQRCLNSMADACERSFTISPCRCLPASVHSISLSPTRPTSRRPSPIPRPIRARRWPPSNRVPTSARWLGVRAGRAKPAGTLTIIHRSDRLEEIVDHLARLGWGAVTVKRLPPAARVLVRARMRTATLRRSKRRRSMLHPPEGGYTEEAEAILRHAAAA